MKKRLLIIGPLPPPFAGPELGTQLIVDSVELQNSYAIRNINTTVRKSNRDKGRLDSTMFLAFLRYSSQLFKELILHRPSKMFYTALTATRLGWFRDATTIVLSILTNTALYVQFRGGHFSNFYNRLFGIEKLLVRILLSRVSLLLVQSEGLRKQFDGILPSSKVAVLPNAIDQQFFDAIDRSQDSQSDKIRILFVGHQSHAKGYCDLLAAYSKIDSSSATLHIMGSALSKERNIILKQGNKKEMLETDPKYCFKKYISENGLNDRIIFEGEQLSGKNKVDIYQRADIFVLPSYSEGFSRAVLEACAAGLPIVTTGVGASKEIIQDGENGFIVEPGDRESLTRVLRILIEDSGLRKEMGTLNRQLCARKFLWKDISKELAIKLEG